MKDVFLTFAQYNKTANAAVLSILNTLSNDEREKERGSYFHSLSGLVRHTIVGATFFVGLFKAALPGNAAAVKAFEPLAGIAVPKDAITEAQWKDVAKSCDLIDTALVHFVEALSEADFRAEVTAPWGKSPIALALQKLVLHGAHHRGQLSQILDELKIDNDFGNIQS
ncbi:MAG: DinB family protein [Treponema sp.]|jgi:uncharacterized damage-inducible protein DinB|nr:DinB family protein [Treponema sp.]